MTLVSCTAAVVHSVKKQQAAAAVGRGHSVDKLFVAAGDVLRFLTGERLKNPLKRLSSARNPDTVDHGTVTRDHGIRTARFRSNPKPRQSRYSNQKSRHLHGTLFLRNRRNHGSRGRVIINHGICTARLRGRRKPRYFTESRHVPPTVILLR